VLAPLATRWGLDERFRPAFRVGAQAMLDHQSAAAGHHAHSATKV
jgi:hypothetical protein